MPRRVSVFLPTLNEESTIGRVIDDIPADAILELGYETEVIVIDGHSTDRTQEIAGDRGVKVFVQKGRGKGRGVKKAFRKFKGDFLFMLDSDNTYPPSYIVDMLKLLKKGKCDVVMGSRLKGDMEAKAMTGMNNFGNKMLTLSANALFPGGHRTSDLCTGMWGFTRIAAKGMKITAKGFDVEAQMYAKCKKKNFRICEIPIRYRCRIESPSKLSSFRDGGAIWWRLFNERFSHD